MKKILLIILSCNLLFLTGCTFVENQAAKQADKRLENYNNQTITVNQGEKFEIVLPANPTGGFVWDIELTYDLIELDSRNFKPAFSLWGNGLETFVFDALKAGRGRVQMKYLRTFELSKNIPVKEIEYQIIIK